jgi:hypothetical protein
MIMMGFPLNEQMHHHHCDRVIGTELIEEMVGKSRIVTIVAHNPRPLFSLLKIKSRSAHPESPRAPIIS